MTTFNDRDAAGRQLAKRLELEGYIDPVVLGIPRGGVIVALAVAKRLHADFGVLLTRKLRAPDQPELAIGAIAEDGQVYLRYAEFASEGYLVEEKTRALREIRRRRRMIDSVLPKPDFADRSVIVVDDGIATGATLIAGLRYLRRTFAFSKLVVAVPVAAPLLQEEIEAECDAYVVLDEPRGFYAVGQAYQVFDQVSDEAMMAAIGRWLRETGRVNP